MKRTLVHSGALGAARPVGWTLLLLLLGCAPGERIEIAQTRTTRQLPMNMRPGISGAQRFGSSTGATHAPETAPENPFRFQVPAGWEELEPTQMRVVNLRPAGDPELDCALTVLPGDGGGLAANVNRWCGQIGLEHMTDEEIAALPQAELLGEAATIVDLRGAYSGMGDEAREDWGLLGLVLATDRFTLFVKMTGPAEKVSAERPGFEEFCASLRAVFPGEDDAHAGHDHPPGEHPTEPEAGLFAYELPEGWREGPPKMLREVNLEAGAGSQCYVIALGGEAGGLAMNLNRWRGEVGLDPLDDAAIDRLPKVEFLGSACPLLEVSGNYQGMGGPEGGGATMTVLGVPLIRAEGSVFVKFVGPEAEIAAERERFLAFITSLEEISR